MLPPSKFFIFCLVASLALVSKAGAGLYGFTEANPYTYEEELLDMETPPLYIPNYRGLMRDNLLMLIDYARSQKPDFKIISHEGEEILTKSLWEYHLAGYNEARKKGLNANDPAFLLNLKKQRAENKPLSGTPAGRYFNAVDGIAVNGLYCKGRQLSPLLKNSGHPILALDYCPGEESFDNAIINSIADRRLLYGFSKREDAFSEISSLPVINESAKNITDISNAHNLLLLTDDRRFTDKNALTEAVRKSNYDIVIINPLFRHHQTYTPEEIRGMQFKKNGTRRLLIAEVNVSEADTRAYYWQSDWEVGNPTWLVRYSFVNEANIITRYWNPAWQQILSRHFKAVVDSGFDGVFFTGIENHRYFEKQTPLE